MSNSSVPLIDYIPRNFFPNRPSPLNLEREYDRAVVINVGSPMSKYLFSLRHSKQFIQQTFGSSMNASHFRASWYSNCFHSVFQPSDFIQRYITPLLHFFDDHYMVGVHVRMRGNYSEWVEKTTYLTMENVTSQMDAIDRILQDNSRAIVYLATDSKVVEKMMFHRFPDRLITAGNLPLMNTGKLTNEAGSLRAFMDLYLLSRCQTLFLTNKSLLSRLVYLVNMNSPIVYYFWFCLLHFLFWSHKQ